MSDYVYPIGNGGNKTTNIRVIRGGREGEGGGGGGGGGSNYKSSNNLTLFMIFLPLTVFMTILLCNFLSFYISCHERKTGVCGD